MSREKKMRLVLAVSSVALLIVVWSQWGAYKEMMSPKKRAPAPASTTATTPTPPATPAAETPARPEPEATPAPTTPEGDVTMAKMVTATPPPDPFHPKARIEASSGRSESAHTAQPPIALSGGVLPVPPVGAVPVEKPIPPKPVRPVLKGIIHGDSSLAVIDCAGKVFFVRIGDRVGGGYRVQAITDSDVELSREAAGSRQGKQGKEGPITLSVQGG